MILRESIIKILKEETSIEKRVLNLINTKGLKQTSLYFGGIETISKILKMRPSVILSKYLHGKVFSINRSGYNIKFTLKHIEDTGNEQFIFYYDVIEGTGYVTENYEKLDILGLEIRMLDDWWNIKYEMKYLFRDFTEKLCDEYNFDYGDIDLEITSKKSYDFFIR